MKATKAKIKAPKKAVRIVTQKDVIAEKHLALFRDDVRLCEDNLFMLFEMKKEEGKFLSIDLHSGALYFFDGTEYLPVDYAAFSDYLKRGGKGSGKYKHLSEKNWQGLVDRERVKALEAYHHPQPVKRRYPTDVTEPDFEAYYIKRIEGEEEESVYLRKLGADRWRVFYVRSVGVPLAFESYTCSEYILKDILSAKDRRSAKGQIDCHDRLVGIDEVQYLSAFMPAAHASKRSKGLAAASDETGTILVNAYYWKNEKSIPCADEEYILSLFTALKEIAVHSVVLEFADEEDDVPDLNEQEEPGEEPESTIAWEEPDSAPADDIEPEAATEESDLAETSAVQAPMSEESEVPQEAASPEPVAEEEPKSTIPVETPARTEKKRKRFSLFSHKEKEDAVVPTEPVEETNEEQTAQTVDSEDSAEKTELTEQSASTPPEETPDNSDPDEGEEPEEENEFDLTLEVIDQASQSEQTDADENREPENSPGNMGTLAGLVLELSEEKPAEIDEAAEVADSETQKEPSNEATAPNENEAKPSSPEAADAQEPAEEGEPAAEAVMAELSATPEEPTQDTEIPAAPEEPTQDTEIPAAPPLSFKKRDKKKQPEQAAGTGAYFELSALVSAYSAAGRKKTKLKSELLQQLERAPLIVPITANAFQDTSLVYVSTKAYRLCGEKIVPFTMMADKTALLPAKENEKARKGVMVKTVFNMGKAYIPVFSDFKTAEQAFGEQETFGIFTLQNLLSHSRNVESIQGITLNPGTLGLKLTPQDFEK